ncbi:MAG: hypothetical protein WKG06_33080 [Segetibacter sp.]
MLIALEKLSPPGINISSPILILAIEISKAASKYLFPVTATLATL